MSGDVAVLADVLMLTGHCGRDHRVMLGTDPAEHPHEDCMFREPARRDAAALIAALDRAGYRIVATEAAG